MLSARPFRELILIAVSLAMAAPCGKAQPLYHPIWTIEARVGQADQVVLGTIGRVSRKTLVAPGGADEIGVTWPDGQFEYTITLTVAEVLKGSLQEAVADLCPARTVGPDNRYEEWSKAQTSLLWFLGPAPKRGERRPWDILPLGKPVPAENHFGGRRGRPYFSRDFSQLKDDEQTLACARAYGKTTSKRQLTHSIHLPACIAGESGPWSYLIVPVEPTLEQRARRLITAPQDFIPKGKRIYPEDLRRLRRGGVDSLRYFKSEPNAQLLRFLLDQPPEKGEAIAVCVRAYEILLHWGVEAPLPKSGPAIRSLDLGDTEVTDQALTQVARLRNLTKLNLQNTRVTDRGLKELAGLTKLTELALSESQLTDAKLRVLREIGLLHCLSQVGGGRKRPKSAEEITSLALCRSPIGDAGLRELAGLKNLAWLDLRDTRVTDAGLKELVNLKNLATLLLQGTQATDGGVAELRRALAKCTIKRGAD
jgi:hypothetical protein